MIRGEKNRAGLAIGGVDQHNCQVGAWQPSRLKALKRLHRVTQVDLDDEALNEAMRLLGTKTKKETINMALREVVQRTRRVEAAQKLFEMGQRGDFDVAGYAGQELPAHRNAASANVSWKAEL